MTSRKMLVLGSVLLAMLAASVIAQDDPFASFVPVTPEMLSNPDDGDWLTFRRTQDYWGYSPLDQITPDNVADLRMVWSVGIEGGIWESVPLVYDGIMYLAMPKGVVQALDATTGDLLWEYRRRLPEDLAQVTRANGIHENTRTLAIEGNLILRDTQDGFLVALDATTGRLVWETLLHDYRASTNFATAGPVVINGKVLTNRSCMVTGGPEACFIAATDLRTGEELWRTYTVSQSVDTPADETWGGVPVDKRAHIGSWMPPSYDPQLNLVYYGTSVTAPYAKFLIGGDVMNGEYLYQTSTLAIDPDTGEIVWYYQHLRDHWDLDHPFGRILLDTVVAPNPDDVAWISAHVTPGEERRVLTGIPGKTGIIYTLDRATGEFLWARPTTPQNIIVNINPETGRVEIDPDLIPMEPFQEVTVCGGRVRNYPEGAYSPLTNAMYFALDRPACRITSFTDEGPPPDTEERRIHDYYISQQMMSRIASRAVTERILGPLDDSAGYIYAVDASTGETEWVSRLGASPMNSLVATSGGLLFGGTDNRRFNAIDQETGAILWETILANAVNGYPISYDVDGRQYIAVGVSEGLNMNSTRNVFYAFALPE